jgi:DNA-binding transcriptional LysR family regulator
MQMRRLEADRQAAVREGRSHQQADGEGTSCLLRATASLSQPETLAAFDDRRPEGTIRIGTPDDYADRFLPEIMARFACPIRVPNDRHLRADAAGRAIKRGNLIWLW